MVRRLSVELSWLLFLTVVVSSVVFPGSVVRSGSALGGTGVFSAVVWSSGLEVVVALESTVNVFASTEIIASEVELNSVTPGLDVVALEMSSSVAGDAVSVFTGSSEPVCIKDGVVVSDDDVNSGGLFLAEMVSVSTTVVLSRPMVV